MMGRDHSSDISVSSDLRSAMEHLFFTYQVAVCSLLTQRYDSGGKLAPWPIA